MENYLNEVNKNFEIVKKDVELHEKGKTSKYDVLQYMIDTKETITWHPSYSLCFKRTSTGGFLSHKGCTRAADLKKFHPDIVEAREVGTIHVYRLRRENPEAIRQFMSKVK
jgi:hypothetical protein